MIKTIVFDLGGVYFTDGIEGLAEKWRKKYGVAEAETLHAWRKTREADAVRLGGITLHVFLDSLRKRLNIGAGDDELALDWFSSYCINEGMGELLDELSEAGLELLYLSNTAPGRDEFLQKKFKFLRHFKDGVLSCKTGRMKPDKRFYGKIHELSLSRGREILFVDDKEGNLAPARKLGWHAIKFVGAKELRRSLREFGVGV